MKIKRVWFIFQSIQAIVACLLVLFIFGPNLFGINSYVVLSGSMEPAIKTGAICYVDMSIDIDGLTLDDIVAFKVGDNLVTHRIYQINEDRNFIMKGDANRSVDSQIVLRKDVIGKVITSIPYLGYVIESIKSYGGILFISLWMALNIIVNLKLDLEERKNEKIK